MQKQLHHSAGLRCLSHLPLSSEAQHHTGTCCRTHYEKQTHPSRGQHPYCQHHPAVIIISRAKLVRWRHFKTHQKKETFWALRKTHCVPFFLETIPWPRQWHLSVNIRKNLPISLDSGMVCYLVYRIFSATHEKDGFLPNPQGVMCGSSGFMMFSDTLQRLRAFHQGTMN